LKKEQLKKTVWDGKFSTLCSHPEYNVISNLEKKEEKKMVFLMTQTNSSSDDSPLESNHRSLINPFVLSTESLSVLA